MKCTNLLRQDHRIILRSLNVLQSMVDSDDGEQIDQDDAKCVLHFLKAFADEHHHLKEEGMLFPELVRVSEAQGGPLRHLLFEHNQERSLVEGLEDALHSRKRTDFAIFANRLIDRVRSHVQKEDGILFPIIDVLLPMELDEKVTTEFEKTQVDPSLLEDLHRLERKYLRKTVQ